MRPLKLAMTAFGPYAGNEIVDFRELGDCAFFLIHGPTGSGKTSILDAMCFALFGKTTGDLRDGKQMRSDYVDPTVATEVIFDFALGGETYRVRRCPEQEVLKKRGSGTTKLPSAATLWRRTELADDQAEGTVVASDWRRVTETAEALLGFKYEQFRQVVMLPQGEFRRLLLANSKDRESILETLFQTELFRRIEDYFKQIAKDLAEKVKELSARKNWTLQEAGAATAEELAARLMEDNEKCLALVMDVASAKQALQTAQEQYAGAKRLKEQFEEGRAAEQQLAELTVREPLIQAKRRELDQAQQALLLAELAAQVELRRAESSDATAKLQQAKVDLADAQEAAKQAADKLACEQEREKERSAAAELVLQLTEMQAKLAQLMSARLQCSQAEVESAQAIATWEQRKIELQEMLKTQADLQERREHLRGEALQVAARQAACTETEQLSNSRRELDELRQKYLAVAGTEKVAQDEFAAAEAAVAAARSDFDAAQREWRLGQAAALARELKPGQPCPVCGSEHHPAPVVNDAKQPSTAELDLKQQLLRRLEQELESRRKPLAEMALTKNSYKEKGLKIRELLGEKVEQELTLLQTLAEEAKLGLEAARQAAVQVEEIERQFNENTAGIELRQANLEAVEAEARQKKAAYEAAKAVVAERESAVPEELRQSGQLAAKLAAATAHRDQMLQALEQAREKSGQAARTVEGLDATHRAALETLVAAENKLAETKDKFTHRLSEAGFADEAAFLAARRTAEVMQMLDQEVKDYGEATVLAKDRANRSTAATAGQTEPDLTVAAEAMNQAEAINNELITAQATLQGTIAKQRVWIAAINGIETEMAGLEQEYAVLGRLSEVANGQNPQRVSFHRYVLAALLEDVMLAANGRLKKMSRGRYALRRMTDPLHKGIAGGLDIEIEDNYTGVSRHVATLSGGETFLASLSLALGLADVVQSFSGGIYLDTIFVDEGFGTLDPESLDMAVQALIELQHKGRLVGIISHVPELKERIEARLEIIPTERGSTTRWSALPGKRSKL